MAELLDDKDAKIVELEKCISELQKIAEDAIYCADCGRIISGVHESGCIQNEDLTN